jgi:hypothetical protein
MLFSISRNHEDPACKTNSPPEAKVHDAMLHPGLDTAFVAVPFLVMLAVGFFHLDEMVATPKNRRSPRRPAIGLDSDGSPILSDPDGRRWRPNPRRK